MRFDDEIHVESDQTAIWVLDIRSRKAIFAPVGRADDAKSDTLVKLGDMALHGTLHISGAEPRSAVMCRTMPETSAMRCYGRNIPNLFKAVNRPANICPRKRPRSRAAFSVSQAILRGRSALYFRGWRAQRAQANPPMGRQRRRRLSFYEKRRLPACQASTPRPSPAIRRSLPSPPRRSGGGGRAGRCGRHPASVRCS